jgi:ATP-dependent RNA helicase DeaD
VERVEPAPAKTAAPLPQPESRSDENAAKPVRSPAEEPSTVAERSPRAAEKPKKRNYERKPRTGREPGFTTLSLNVGAEHLVTPADLVGKIAGVTRLPAAVVGAIDIYETHSHVDVAAEAAEIAVKKLDGIRLKNIALRPAVVTPAS